MLADVRATRPSRSILHAILVALAACSAPGPRPFAAPIPELVAANEAAGDPYGGRFPFEEALAGLPAEGRLHAIFITDEGEIDCVLEPDHAPIAVANFVGLARGIRPFRDESGGAWITEHYYNGTHWHRAIEGQLVQGGRRGDTESAGFVIQDEISPGDSFARAGVLAVANAGPNSGSTQFFITTGSTPHLQGLHTIFGQCDDEAVARALERRSVRGQDPAPTLQEVRIMRK